jgi:hypothetical protein
MKQSFKVGGSILQLAAPSKKHPKETLTGETNETVEIYGKSIKKWHTITLAKLGSVVIGALRLSVIRL